MAFTKATTARVRRQLRDAYAVRKGDYVVVEFFAKGDDTKPEVLRLATVTARTRESLVKRVMLAGHTADMPVDRTMRVRTLVTVQRFAKMIADEHPGEAVAWASMEEARNDIMSYASPEDREFIRRGIKP